MAGCIAHAWNGRISTSILKSDVTIVFLDPNFLRDAKILAIHIHLKQIFAWVFRTSWPKMGILGAKWGKGWCDIDPQQTRSYFSGFLRLCKFWWKSIKKCDRDSARRRTDWHTDKTQTDFIICPMLYAIAMAQINTHKRQNYTLMTMHSTEISKLNVNTNALRYVL